MQSLATRTLSNNLSQALVALFLGLSLTFFVAQWSIVWISGAVLAFALLVIFLQRPDLGVLVTLATRSSTDLSFWILGGALVTDKLGALPNIGLILILIVAGGLFILSRGIPVLRLPGGILLTLLLFTGLVGMLRSDSPLASFNEWLPVVSGLIIYALAAHLFPRRRQIHAVISALAVSFVPPAIIGFYQLATGQGMSALGVIGKRIYGTFIHPNALGVYLVLILSVFVCQALAHSGKRKFVSLLIVAASGVLLAGTLTRIAWIGAVVVLLVVGALRSRALLVIASFLVVIVAGTVPFISARLADPLGGSFADRIGLWRGLLYEWADLTRNDAGIIPVTLNRLGGLGPGIVAALTTPGRGVPYAAHNDYLRVLVEYGLFGLGLFLALHLLLFAFAFRTWKMTTDKAMAAVALSFVALTVAYPIMNLTENIFAATQNQIYFWSLAGLTVAVSRLSPRAEASNPPGVGGSSFPS